VLTWEHKCSCRIAKPAHFGCHLPTTAANWDFVPRFIVGLISAVTAIAASILSTFKIKEKNYSRREVFSGIEIEYHKYINRSNEYTTDEDEAFNRFSSKINEIKQQYADQELSFWQPSEKSTLKDKPQQQQPTDEPPEDDKDDNTNDAYQENKA